MFNVLGIVKGKGKNGDFTVLHVTSEFDDYLKERSVGKKVETLYLSKNFECNIGDNVEVTYGVGYQGKAIVKDVKIVK